MTQKKSLCYILSLTLLLSMPLQMASAQNLESLSNYSIKLAISPHLEILWILSYTIQFSATAPSITNDQMYVMYVLGQGETSNSFAIGPLTEIVLQVNAS